ncbi:MAG: dual specificity protein phosphatase family protein [Nanoarchaeota archaeon]
MEKRLHKNKPVFEYSKINEYIYIGTNLCCAEHFKKALLKKGIKANVSLEEKRLDHPIGVDYYLWLPTKDQTPPSFKQLLIGAKFIKDLIKNKIKVYIHCEFGHGRSPTLVIAYFILDGKKVKEAIKLIKNKRPSIHLSNSQIKALENFEKKIR